MSNLSDFNLSGSNYKAVTPIPVPTPMPTPAPMPPFQQEMMQYRIVFPEVFYRLQPYIVMVCDEMDSCGSAMPNIEMVDRITDNIYDDVCKMYPDMKDYVESSKPETLGQPFDIDFNFRRRFRRRGLFRDFITTLILAELFRRRRRFPW